ncbi:hypothetical protein [Roseisolibacter agri]|uniref:Lipocalin-like domain-containing protein n=1 Tax=Roseisolibacter agri TaxID=2014610 RepID=A0AA37V299_9BACT|nr:hypothetical protein [Roseisolibacter agri]GLC24942.1 hypothetical protein rosag_14550 [Roseisolibacter agri]
MRRTAFPLAALTASVAACASGEKAADTAAAVDTTAPAATAAPAPAAPAALTAADIAGEWAGTSYATPGDSVVARWHIRSVTDSTAVLTFDDTKKTVNYRTTLAGDSLVSVSEPYTPPGAPANAPKTTFHAVGRLTGDTLRGVTHVMLASKPDSMVAEHRWVATRPK